MSMDEMRLELADVKHELKSTQVELNLLDERVRKQTSSIEISSKTKADSSNLEHRIAYLEQLLEKTTADLRTLSNHTTQALKKLAAIENEIISHENRLDEVVKLKGTLTSISQAIGQPASPSKNTTSSYRVKAGDSLEKIARSHKTSISALKNLNNLKNDKIVVGQELRIPDESP